MVDQPPNSPDPPTTYHYLTDALGSVIGLTDANGTLVERYTYDTYGKPYIETWNAIGQNWQPASTSAVGNPFLWTGHRFDAAVSLYHTSFRSYDPRLGRWLQQDPLGYNGGVNLYEYVLSAPMYWIDPLGLDPYDLDNLGEKSTPGNAGPIGKNITGLKTEAAIAGLEATGGVGHVPVLDPGTAQNVVLVGAELAQLPADVVTGKGALKLAKQIPGLAKKVVRRKPPGGPGVLRFTQPPSEPCALKPKVNRNTANDEPATLYRKYDKNRQFRKHGVTHHDDPAKRYTQKEIDGGKVIRVERGPRREMLKKERELVETDPGPDNHEPWAGKRKNQ